MWGGREAVGERWRLEGGRQPLALGGRDATAGGKEVERLGKKKRDKGKAATLKRRKEMEEKKREEREEKRKNLLNNIIMMYKFQNNIKCDNDRWDMGPHVGATSMLFPNSGVSV